MLYFIRHGQTDWNADRKIQGITDIPLNKKGIEQAHNVADTVRAVQWNRIISSPLGRAKQTAEILNQKIGLSIETDDRLCEFDLGELEGQSLTVLTPDVWQMLGQEPQKVKAEGLPETYKRVQSFMQETDPTLNTLIVAHSGLFKIISYYLQYPREFRYDLFAPTYRDLWVPNLTLIPLESKIP